MKRKRVGFGVLLLLGILSLFVFVKLISNDSETTAVSGTTKEILVTKEEKARYKQQQQKLHNALKTYFDKAIQTRDIVGVGISIVKGDSILIATGFGKRKIKGKANVDANTIFRLGSLSKGFGGILAASFQSEGKFDFNDKVTAYIPQFQLGDSINTEKIKIAHILSHSSGAPYHSFTNLVEAGLPMSKIAGRFDEVNVQSEPGRQYSYQNAMFALSQVIFLKTSGIEVKKALQNKFFTPLGMTSISMDHKTLLEMENVALPHARRSVGWKSLPLKDRYYNAVLAGGINASSLDMAKWMRFLLGHNPEVLKQSSFEKAFEPVIQIDYNNKYYQRWPKHLQSHYGLGWRLHTLKTMDSAVTKTMWHHGGSVNNYRNEIALYPKDDLGICVLLNGNSRIAQTVIPDIYKIIAENEE